MVKCAFISISTKKRCTEDAADGIDFCSRHKNTIQATHRKKTASQSSPQLSGEMTIEINRDENGLFLEPSSGIYFNTNGEAYGYKTEDGVKPLNQHYIQICKLNGWPYIDIDFDIHEEEYVEEDEEEDEEEYDEEEDEENETYYEEEEYDEDEEDYE